ncbi:MAG: hypothetical protein ACR2NZ_08360 [Rubripirellula sp.]
MSHGRRTNDRRRRVLYSAHQADHAPSTAASRREAIRLREARRPQAAYGSRVHRRIRGRWFSLVPIRRRTMVTVASLIGLAAVLLCGAHYASVAWPAIAYRPEIARPLRLDRPDSFGRWFMVAMLTVSAGISLMIYQLRRYRNDDFQGHYRLWRLVIIVMAVASINSLVSIIDWSGALLDAGFGKRVALTGSDWIRLLVSLGGAVLALRLVAEVRRCRSAVIMMSISSLLFAIPEAAKWNVLEVDSLVKWTLATSAPLLGCTALLLALGSYLRMLYREVKEINESDSLRDRFQNMRMRLFQNSDAEETENDGRSNQEVAEDERRGWWRRKTKDPAAAVQDAEDDADDLDEPEEAYEEESDPDQSKKKSSTQGDRGKRRWLGLRKAKPTSTKDSKAEEAKPEPKVAKEKPKTEEKKKRRFSLRRSPEKTDSKTEESRQPKKEVVAKDEPAKSESETKSKPKRGLGWFARKNASDKKPDPESSEPKRSSGSRDDVRSAQDSNEEPQIDPDEIDWSTLSKAERRRLRKQLKRQNRAA